MPPKSLRNGDSRPPKLPSNFYTIRQLLDNEVEHGRMVGVIGVVKNYRLPIQSLGPDFKTTVTLFDVSTEDNGSIDVNIFRKESDMPKFAAGDLVIVSSIKFQLRGYVPSLLANYRTTIHVFDAQRLTESRRSGNPHEFLTKRSGIGKGVPTDPQTSYALWMFDTVDKTFVPDREALAAQAKQSLNIKDKYSLLKNVRDQKFADLIGQVVKEPFDHGESVGIWLSDYTANSAFFNKMKDAEDLSEDRSGRTGDSYGYMDKSYKKVANLYVDHQKLKWIGPYGKQSIQITLWEPHAQFIREHVHIGDWVRLRNVQVGFGHNTKNLEGFLREDCSFPSRVYVHVFDLDQNRETVDPRLKDALKRKREYEMTNKAGALTGMKRIIQEPTENTKSKRSGKRRKQREKEEEQRAKEEAALNLHEHGPYPPRLPQLSPRIRQLTRTAVKCENQDKTVMPLSCILEPVSYQFTINNESVKVELPFTCAKYRTQVRVVDFHPVNVEDFAVCRVRSENGPSGDNGDSQSGTESDLSSSSPCARQEVDKGLVWEWYFALKLEEAFSVPPKNRLPATTWVVVGNPEAQLLTGLNAANLRDKAQAELLKNLREHLFILWGNLEERKSKVEIKKQLHNKNPVCAPPADSSDGENGEADAGVQSLKNRNTVTSEQHGRCLSLLSNRPFICCLLQYGIRVSANEDDGVHAGDGTGWQRIFKLFGTKIASN